MFALIDSNNFYVSAERAFQPELSNKAGCVLSNNDGCAISRSNEAKEMGIKMGMPFFEMQEQQQSGRLWWRSSNYTLYQDMMRRITSIVRQTFPDQEIYSIDECFCDLSAFKFQNIQQLALELRNRILKYTGVPVCIGVGSTKTLAKMANKIAKKDCKQTGVCYLDSPDKVISALNRTDIGDVWGIGPRYAVKLIQQKVFTAYDFINLPEDHVLKLMTVQGRRTWRELRGLSCIPMEYVRAAKQGISTSRSFSSMETELAPMQQAIATYVANAAVKLRGQNSVCGQLLVYMQTSRFIDQHLQHASSIEVKIDVPTCDTGKLIKLATNALSKIYVKGYRYQKVGVEFRDLRPDSQVQSSLFETSCSPKQQKLQKALKIIDQLNHSYGKDTIRYAAMGYDQPWAMRQNFLSRKFTSRIEDIIIVNAC